VVTAGAMSRNMYYYIIDSARSTHPLEAAKFADSNHITPPRLPHQPDRAPH